MQITLIQSTVDFRLPQGWSVSHLFLLLGIIFTSRAQLSWRLNWYSGVCLLRQNFCHSSSIIVKNLCSDVQPSRASFSLFQFILLSVLFHCIRGLRFSKHFEEEMNGEFQAHSYDHLFSRIMPRFSDSRTPVFASTVHWNYHKIQAPLSTAVFSLHSTGNLQILWRKQGTHLNVLPSLLDLGHSDPEVSLWFFIRDLHLYLLREFV